jgi:demethylmenaquinone methyltransferase/2-methoxy-6-polyprenyl-1,4-benzoquinol methylase
VVVSAAVSDGPNPQAVRAMFARVAPRYDLLNRLLSLGQDQRWRRKLRAAVASAPPGPVLDLATGTGDVALGFAGRRVVGCDFCLEMLALAQGKDRKGRARWVAGDAMALPLRSGSVAAVTVAFGLRNFPDRLRGLGEIHRVLRPGGVLAVLEFHPIEHRWGRLVHGFWRRAVIVPLGGLLSGDREAYRYLPASSQRFLSRTELAALAQQVGFSLRGSETLGVGVAALSVFAKGGGA